MRLYTNFSCGSVAKNSVAKREKSASLPHYICQILECSSVAGVSRGGGGGRVGVQAYNFGNFNFEIRVEGEGHDTSRLF